MTVKAFEEAVWTTERIRIVIRATAGSQVKEYGYTRAADQNWRLSELIKSRIQPCVDDSEVVVIRGDGTPAPGNVGLGGLRVSYRQG